MHYGTSQAHVGGSKKVVEKVSKEILFFEILSFLWGLHVLQQFAL